MQNIVNLIDWRGVECMLSFWSENVEGRDNLEDLDLDGKGEY